MKTKKFMLASLYAAILGLVSCSQEEILNESNLDSTSVTTEVTTDVTTIDESEISGSELFNTSMQNMSQLAGTDAYNELQTAFEERNGSVDSKTTSQSVGQCFYKMVRILYPTTDQDEKQVEASALVIYPVGKKMTEVMLINHGTHLGCLEIPTKFTAIESILAATGALCVLPDYIGLGSTSDHPDLYLNYDVQGRTSVDALLAVLDYAKKKKLNLCDDYKTSIVGYSQGGSVSLASLREVQQRDEETQKLIKLDRVFCGDGPYDLSKTFQTYISDAQRGNELGLAPVIPMIINSMFNSYPSEVEGLNYEDFFTAKCLATGVPQAIRDNRETVIDVMVKLLGWSMTDVLDMDYLNENPQDLLTLITLMERQNLCKGWEPKYKLKFLHCNPDGLVPFCNFEEAVENLMNDNITTEIIELDAEKYDNPLSQHGYGILVMDKEILLGNY